MARNPTFTKAVNFRMTPELYAKVVKLSERQQRNVSSAVRLILEKALLKAAKEKF